MVSTTAHCVATAELPRGQITVQGPLDNRSDPGGDHAGKDELADKLQVVGRGVSTRTTGESLD
jgi:hypothetical protein